jgi:ribose 5-phosphate isomerase B
MAKLRIAVGSDHAGYEGPAHYKPEIMAHLVVKGHDVINCGTDSAESVDYPDIAERVSQEVLSGRADLGILICGTGIGVCMTANRLRGIRAAVCTTPLMARLSREHNAANVLCLGRRILSLTECKEIIDAWIAEPISQVDRHKRRVEKMDALNGDVLR